MKKNKIKDSETAEIREAIILAALEIAGVQGWESVCLEDVAISCEISVQAVYEQVDDRDDILILFARMVEKNMFAAASDDESGCSSARERIFDLLMERYDILNANRKGVEAIISYLRSAPGQAVFVMPYIGRSMAKILENAGIDTGGISGALKIAGLTGVYLKVLRTWAEDESEDLSKTMAALDKDLGRCEVLVNSFGFC